MKTLKFLSLCLLIPAFLLVACDKDDEPSTEPNNNSGNEEPTPTPTPDPEPESGVSDAVYAEFNIPSEEDSRGDVLAFPGAEGGGMYVTGGRGGKVIHVTTLEDNSSQGSLRYALNQSGARTIVFDVAGTIELKSTLRISNGDVTIAGQTAPGDGICIGYNTVRVDADNVIIRFVRFRCSDAGTGSDLGDSSDGIWGRYHKDIILDHCTMSWSIDECASFYANQNFTMQWCIISEAFNMSLHSGDSGHGYGGLWGGRNASFHHNLMAHNNSRNARIDHPGIYSTYLDTHRGNVDLRNNVIYNWMDNSTYGGEDGWFNIVNSYYKPGPASLMYGKHYDYYVDAYWYNTSSKVGSAYPELYLSGNYNEQAIDESKYPNGIYYHDQSSYGTNPQGVVLNAPLSIKADDVTTCYTTTHTAAEAFTKVTDYAGPSLSRDAVDKRVCEETKNGTATYTGSKTAYPGMVDTLSDIDGFPTLSGTADADTDGDGMPDWFENQYGLDANDASDATEYYLDKYGRYTNLEMYCHYLVKDIVANQNANGTYTALD